MELIKTKLDVLPFTFPPFTKLHITWQQGNSGKSPFAVATSRYQGPHSQYFLKQEIINVLARTWEIWSKADSKGRDLRVIYTPVFSIQSNWAWFFSLGLTAADTDIQRLVIEQGWKRMWLLAHAFLGLRRETHRQLPVDTDLSSSQEKGILAPIRPIMLTIRFAEFRRRTVFQCCMSCNVRRVCL